MRDYSFGLCLALGVVVFAVAGIKSCSDDLDAQCEEVRAVLRWSGYTPLEVPRSYRDEDGVREVRARVERGGVVGEVVVFRDGTGPWRIAAEKR